ncbi:MAG TPA: hypothetical protein VFU49_13580 [Ktedonobacteraceae bacterium]|nr:hypothetical protein [Ktedonobacteraceae bacterium]
MAQRAKAELASVEEAVQMVVKYAQEIWPTSDDYSSALHNYGPMQGFAYYIKNGDAKKLQDAWRELKQVKVGEDTYYTNAGKSQSGKLLQVDLRLTYQEDGQGTMLNFHFPTQAYFQ